MSDQQATVISMRGGVVSREVAEVEFARFLEMMDLDAGIERMDRDKRTSFEANRLLILEALERGTLYIDNQGQPVYTPVAGDNTNAITFYEPAGDTFLAMDNKRKDADMAKSFALLAALTKQPDVRFGKMKNRDLKVCTAVMSIFLA